MSIGDFNDPLSPALSGLTSCCLFFVGVGCLGLPFCLQCFLIAGAAGLVELLAEKSTRFDEEMPAAHGRVENLELEDLERLRVVLRAPFLNLRPKSFLHQEPHEGMGRVIGAARFPSQADSQVEPVARNLLDPENLRLLAPPV